MSSLPDRILQGDIRAAAHLIRDLDDRVPSSVEALKALYPKTGRAYLVGVTGTPGCGKSTLVDGLIERYRQQGERVGVVAVDPSSPFSGGAILGDRIRMQRHATDDGVFIRSLATRGHLGGLSRSTLDVVLVLDAMGFDTILIETVGVGQDEIEIVELAHTVVVVTVPGSGDGVQAMKAGILEAADIFCVNKCDREGKDRAVRDLLGMLELRPRESAAVEIVETVATGGQGLDELQAAITRHRAVQQESGAWVARRTRRARRHLIEILEERIFLAAEDHLAGQGGLDVLARQVADRSLDPYTAAEQVARAVLRSPERNG